MADINELLEQLPIGDIAAKLGVSEADAKAAAASALPSLVLGLQENAKDPQQARSITKAVKSKKKTVSVVENGISLSDVDENDGAKIVKNIFGSKTDDVAAKLGGIGGLDSGGFQKLLGLLAPLVLAWIAKEKFGGKSSGSSGGFGGLGDLLGGLFGGKKSSGSSSSGGGLGDLLGGVLGGSGGGVGDLLGGLLGGGKK